MPDRLWRTYRVLLPISWTISYPLRQLRAWARNQHPVRLAYLPNWLQKSLATKINCITRLLKSDMRTALVALGQKMVRYQEETRCVSAVIVQLASCLGSQLPT